MKANATPSLSIAADNALRLLAQIEHELADMRTSFSSATVVPNYKLAALRELARDAAAPLKHALRVATLSD